MSWKWPWPRKPATPQGAAYHEREPEPEEQTSLPPFDVLGIGLTGLYRARIIEAETKRMNINPERHMVKVKLDLIPDDPIDQSVGYTHLTPYDYCRLLEGLAIARTNNVSVLIGRNVNAEIKMSSGPGWTGPVCKIVGPFLV